MQDWIVRPAAGRVLSNLVLAALPLSLLLACTGSAPAPGETRRDDGSPPDAQPSPAAPEDTRADGGGAVALTPGTPVQGIELPLADREAFRALSSRIAEVSKLDAAGLRAA